MARMDANLLQKELFTAETRSTQSNQENSADSTSLRWEMAFLQSTANHLTWKQIGLY